MAYRVQRLARLLDRPLFPWKNLIVGFSVAQYLFEGFLSLRQYRVLKQTRPPKVLQNEVSQDVFDKSQVGSAPNHIHGGILTRTRRMDEQRQSTHWLAVSTVKSKTRHSSTSTFSPNSGNLPDHGSFDLPRLDLRERYHTLSSSSSRL
jgi:hypothetical protein